MKKGNTIGFWPLAAMLFLGYYVLAIPAMIHWELRNQAGTYIVELVLAVLTALYINTKPNRTDGSYH